MPRRLLQITALIAILGAAGWYFTRTPASPASAGGRLIVTQRTEPSSFNRMVVPIFGTELISRLTNATLIRLNRSTGEIEPALASTWTVSDDGLTFTLRLLDGVTFSDGTPFTASDVLFTFQVLYDPKIASPIATGMRINDQPINARALDEHTVVLTFPARYGPGLSILDTLPILPKHKLEKAFAAGDFVSAWGVTAPLSDFAGLGPFVIADRKAGQSVTLRRNDHFWKKDQAGRRLPYLDEIEIDFVPEQDAEMLRLENGTADVVSEQIRPEDVNALERAQKAGTIQLSDAGVSVDPVGLWFNLAPNSPTAKVRPWLQREELRLAIAHAIDRKKLIDTVYLGAAEAIYSPVTRGYGMWYAPDLPHPSYDVAEAKRLLESIGLKDRNGDGKLDDASGKPVQISVITRKGNTILERTMAAVQEQLAAIGLTLNVVALEKDALLAQFGKGNYDTIYYGAPVSSTDPSNNSDFWLSSGAFHFWNPVQDTPATPWEKQIDDLMRIVSTSTDTAKRVATFRDVQSVFIAHSPMVYFAAAKVTIAMSARVSGAMPVVLQPQVLWKPELLGVNGAGRQ